MGYNFGLHDGITPKRGATSLANYTARMEHITARLEATGAKKLLLVLTTWVGGSGADPTDPAEEKITQLNAAASKIAKEHDITVVDLHKTMKDCGAACVSCKPHCGGAGYAYLIEHGLLPAVK